MHSHLHPLNTHTPLTHSLYSAPHLRELSITTHHLTLSVNKCWWIQCLRSSCVGANWAGCSLSNACLELVCYLLMSSPLHPLTQNTSTYQSLQRSKAECSLLKKSCENLLFQYSNHTNLWTRNLEAAVMRLGLSEPVDYNRFPIHLCQTNLSDYRLG